MNTGLHAALAAGTLIVPTLLVGTWVGSAKERLAEAEATPDPNAAVATAAASDVGYCTPELKKVLRRVLQSCGLSGASGGRGCQPVDAKSVVGGDDKAHDPKAKGGKKAGSVSGDDFNTLFLPLKERAGIIQFDKESSDLDPGDLAMLDRIFADQRGASYFFVVSRSSPEGSEVYNRNLSEQRGKAVLSHLQSTFKDQDLNKEVGILWLGEEFAQLDQEFCSWQRSGSAEACQSQDLNRSAFVAWIDCRL